MNSKRKIFFFIALCLSTQASVAAEKIPVNISVKCPDDLVGERLAYKTREAIRSSNKMRYVSSRSDSLVLLSLICVPPEPDDNSLITTYSQAILFVNRKGAYDYQIMHGVGRCGTERTDECADDLAKDLDLALTDLWSHMKDGTL